MAEPALQIPEPTSEDPEAVATALETAAIFGAQGDVREALRWVRRAAELASDDGQDMRALSLARTAADLSNHLQSSSPPRVQSNPPPRPPAPSSHSAAGSAARSSRPLPPLERAPAPAEMTPPPPPPPLPPPLQHMARPARESYAEATRRADESDALTVPRTRLTDPGPPPTLDYRRESAPPRADSEAARPTPPQPLRPVASAPPPEPEADSETENDRVTPEPPAKAEPASYGPLLRQTVRVAVSPNPTRPGTYVVELLDEGVSPEAGMDEGLLVLLDPESDLLQTE